MNRLLWKNSAYRIIGAGTFLLTLLLPACAADWQHNVTTHGISFGRLRQAESGTMTGRISEPIEFQGQTCQAGWIRFYADWTLQSCVIGAAVPVGENSIPINSWVEFDPDGYVAIVAFPHNVVIQQHECIGTSGDQKGFHVAFYPGGQLKYFFTPDNVHVHGIPCKGGWFSLIALHENGHVSACTLAETIDIGGNVYKKGQTITLTPEGMIADQSS